MTLSRLIEKYPWLLLLLRIRPTCFSCSPVALIVVFFQHLISCKCSLNTKVYFTTCNEKQIYYAKVYPRSVRLVVSIYSICKTLKFIAIFILCLTMLQAYLFSHFPAPNHDDEHVNLFPFYQIKLFPYKMLFNYTYMK